MQVRVGRAWIDGDLALFEQHLDSETASRLMRAGPARWMTERLPPPPRVLPTTVPGEVHAPGRLMAGCMLVREGCETLSLGVPTPLVEIVAAARPCRVDVLAQGLSAALGPREVGVALTRLRAQLPPEVLIWTGGPCPP